MSFTRSTLGPKLFRRFLGAWLVLTATTAASAAAQTETGRFFVQRGTDTLVTERFTRTARELRGQIAWSNGMEMAYTARLLPNGAVARIEVDFEQEGVPLRLIARQNAQNVIFEVRGRTGADTSLKAPPKTIASRQGVPILPASMALVEQMVRFTRGRNVTGLATILPLQTKSGTSSLRRVPGDTVVATVADGRVLRLRVDRQGRVLGGFNPESGVRVLRGR